MHPAASGRLGLDADLGGSAASKSKWHVLPEQSAHSCRSSPPSVAAVRLVRPDFRRTRKISNGQVAIRRLGAQRLKLFYPPDERFREGEIFVYFLPTTNSDPSSSGAIFDVVNMIWCALGVDFDNSTNSRWKFQDRS